MAQIETVAKGVLIGLAAGLAASLAMDLFQRAYAAAQGGSSGDDEPEQDEPSTIKMAHRLAVAATGRRLPEAYASYGGSAVHYATGAAAGAFYGATAAILPGASVGYGTVFGAALWLAIDEGLVAAIRLGPPPQDAAMSEHAYGFASHLVYGLTLEATRRAMTSATTRPTT